MPFHINVVWVLSRYYNNSRVYLPLLHNNLSCVDSCCNNKDDRHLFQNSIKYVVIFTIGISFSQWNYYSEMNILYLKLVTTFFVIIAFGLTPTWEPKMIRVSIAREGFRASCGLCLWRLWFYGAFLQWMRRFKSSSYYNEL